jgi:hypothetical protein
MEPNTKTQPNPLVSTLIQTMRGNLDCQKDALGRPELSATPSGNVRSLREAATRRLGFDPRGGGGGLIDGKAAGGLAGNLLARETFRSRSLGPQPASAAAKSNAARLAAFLRRYSRCRQAPEQHFA